MMHSMGIDLSPYTKLFLALKDRIRGEETQTDPAAGTFTDGLAVQKVLDAIRKSSAEHSWVAIK